MTWTDFNEYNSDVQFQIGQRIQKLRIDKKIAAVDLAAVLDSIVIRCLELRMDVQIVLYLNCM